MTQPSMETNQTTENTDASKVQVVVNQGYLNKIGGELAELKHQLYAMTAAREAAEAKVEFAIRVLGEIAFDKKLLPAEKEHMAKIVRWQLSRPVEGEAKKDNL